MIQEIQNNEIEELYNLLKEAFHNDTELEKFKQLYNLSKENKNTHIWGYYINNKLVGTLTFNVLILPNNKELTIWNVAVNKTYRKQGIATKLMLEVEKFAKKDLDISRIWLFSNKNRIEAHKLYRKLGYDEEYDKAFIKWIHKGEK